MDLDYGSYLKIDDLLSLQEPRSDGEHDELLFIIVHQVDVLETMTPLDFDSFRSFLGSSSGFQSAQFRELEFVLGKKDVTHLDRFVGDTAHGRLRRRFDEPSVWHRFVALLARRGHPVDPGPAAVPTSPDGAVQDVLVAAYRDNADLVAFCERLVDVTRASRSGATVT